MNFRDYTQRKHNILYAGIVRAQYRLQHFWKYVLKQGRKWVDIVKPTQVKTIPDILTPDNI